MPISDQDGYQPGHFKRVYEYIIKPACLNAGYHATRADDVAETNLIALDIVKRIVDSDMAICDLSSKNPNVMYEAGIRQAFDYPVVFIKDFVTPRIFDIQGFRDVSYDESLRVDTIESAVSSLTQALIATDEKKEGVNSLISLLGITAAKVSTKEISVETDLILNAIKALESRIAKVEPPKRPEFLKSTVFNGLEIPAPSWGSVVKVGDKIKLEDGYPAEVLKNDFNAGGGITVRVMDLHGSTKILNGQDKIFLL